MSKIRIHELSFCEREDSELHNVVGGESAFFTTYYDTISLSEERPDYYYFSEDLLYPSDTYTDSVQETVVNKDGYYGQARVVKGRKNGRKFVRSSASARV
ncbi:MAG: hypothetical protein KI793_13220 [Rivularia sp. (in: Bacteria)]|nr:hypothetical protein [Rivularia sp. MS3]